MYHKLFRIILHYTAIALLLTACGASSPTLVPATTAPLAAEADPAATSVAPTNTSEPTATQVVLGVTTGVIAFQSNRDGNYEIYVMNGDGTGLTNLTNNPADDSGPVWSPDGKQILFTSSRDGNNEIYVMNADGSAQTNLTNDPATDGEVGGGGLLQIDWSPDGKKILFASDRDGNSEIHVMNADGSAPINLTNNPAHDIFPKWSVDGTQIGFTRDGIDGIQVMNADGSNTQQLTDYSGDNAFPRWSPDGKKIVFVGGHGDGTYEIYLMNADGSNRTQLTNSPGYDDNMDPRWSPDGKQIIFWSSRDGNAELYVMNADGTDQTRLTDHEADDSDPMWQP